MKSASLPDRRGSQTQLDFDPTGFMKSALLVLVGAVVAAAVVCGLLWVGFLTNTGPIFALIAAVIFVMVFLLRRRFKLLASKSVSPERSDQLNGDQ